MLNEELKNDVKGFVKMVNELELEQAASLKTRLKLEESIKRIMDKNKENKEARDIAINAIEILRRVSDEAVTEAYKFLEESLNAALERMFTNTIRKIRLREYTLGNQYPQLQIDLIVSGGKVRSLKSDSGHGIAQIVSLLSILSLIVITNSRRIMVLDEVISGLSENNLKIITDILWTFTQIGFQFIINEHGYIPVGSKVYQLELVADVSRVKDTYVEECGVYLSDSEGGDTIGMGNIGGLGAINSGKVNVRNTSQIDVSVEKDGGEDSIGEGNVISL